MFRDGRPNRARIAEIAFRDPAKLQELTGWVHPPTIREMRAQLDRALADRGVPLIVIDAPLLIEADLAPVVRLRWSSWTPPTRSASPARAPTAAGPTTRSSAARPPRRPWRKSARAPHVVLDNNGSEEETRAAVAQLFRQWVSDPSSTAASCRAQDPARSGCPSGGERNG